MFYTVVVRADNRTAGTGGTTAGIMSQVKGPETVQKCRSHLRILRPQKGDMKQVPH